MLIEEMLRSIKKIKEIESFLIPQHTKIIIVNIFLCYPLGLYNDVIIDGYNCTTHLLWAYFHVINYLMSHFNRSINPIVQMYYN